MMAGLISWGGGPILWIYSPHQSDGKWPDHFYFNPSGDFDFGVDELAKDYHENREEYILETKKLLVKEML